jgi:hypothetical protein
MSVELHPHHCIPIDYECLHQLEKMSHNKKIAKGYFSILSFNCIFYCVTFKLFTLYSFSIGEVKELLLCDCFNISIAGLQIVAG